jgi:hypothetical protein
MSPKLSPTMSPRLSIDSLQATPFLFSVSVSCLYSLSPSCK